ncbi:MAG: GreA/GreB family elongation factor [Erysipelotrichales bacterium]|nr:GreA/GreB family elongation factor [Erysipelotrichales bacterium]
MEIIVDQLGYQQFMDILESYKQESIDNGLKGNEAYSNDPGNTWHDNFDFEVMMQKSRTIANKIDKMYEAKKFLKVIEKEDLAYHIVNIGDTLKLEIIYGDNDIEYETVILTGKYIPNVNLDIEEITLNSPIGKAIFKQKVGELIEFTLNDQKTYVKVIEKVK